ncbi:MAG: AAA family ATPase [Acidobacteria bacterium]|nr:AAA family ATPase [Acidobacteriota bacterium]
MSLVTLLAGGHLLIEDVPGVGKTTLARSIAGCLACSFQRIQFTSDLLPSDIVGVSVYDQREGTFEFKPGPVFANIVLADEINRTTPKTQSSLLEAMAEGSVTVDNETRPLPRPFMVLATQNPMEHHGTYPLPESQLDRFMMRIHLGYPGFEAEKEILRRQALDHPINSLLPVLTTTQLLGLQEEVRQVRVSELLLDYLMAIVAQTRTGSVFESGVSPRGTLTLYRAAQALALIDGRDYCVADDIKRLVLPVFTHRLVVSQRHSRRSPGRGEVELALQDILGRIEVPI